MMSIFALLFVLAATSQLSASQAPGVFMPRGPNPNPATVAQISQSQIKYLLIADVLQALMPAIAEGQQIPMDFLSPSCRNANFNNNFVRNYYFTNRGAALIFQRTNHHSVKKPFQTHSRLLGIATPVAFFPCFLPQQTIGGDLHNNKDLALMLSGLIAVPRTNNIMSIIPHVPTTEYYGVPIQNIPGLSGLLRNYNMQDMCFLSPEEQTTMIQRFNGPAPIPAEEQIIQAFVSYKATHAERIRAFLEAASVQLKRRLVQL